MKPTCSDIHGTPVAQQNDQRKENRPQGKQHGRRVTSGRQDITDRGGQFGFKHRARISNDAHLMHCVGNHTRQSTFDQHFPRGEKALTRRCRHLNTVGSTTVVGWKWVGQREILGQGAVSNTVNEDGVTG